MTRKDTEKKTMRGRPEVTARIPRKSLWGNEAKRIAEDWVR